MGERLYAYFSSLLFVWLLVLLLVDIYCLFTLSLIAGSRLQVLLLVLHWSFKLHLVVYRLGIVDLFRWVRVMHLYRCVLLNRREIITRRTATHLE